ncbi:bifunctional phosphopantothenoylcysteine decarboxylase/phosphopantothenate--cysteine ligase CoaBC [Atopobacter phocae]|uniref:bifunctional phosphopantothenoylcysteine decarboxylase/phosphopantothenate--cysteine ligase CoaBC n=1 Tax=Atopobacter phocae TaxID=136492 RepID=UPI00047284FA|nr:bifunctional phosphopantothenoylcysteine decarboxylase/phosphopantothenate--cysteine ligase CoaBC [Atopobacter phocae]
MLNGKHIIVGVTGGIAAYKIPELVRQLIKKGATVRVIMTKEATRFITPFTFEVLTKNHVLVDGEINDNPIAHIELADWADLFVVTPLTANTLAKFANGIADNELTSTWLAFDGTKVIVPAMNVKMWNNPRTQSNLQMVQADGVFILEPEEGFLAEGYAGKGRMMALDIQVQSIQAIDTLNELGLSRTKMNALKDKRILITAGGTIEAIDPVRYIGNHSSGKMGVAISNMAALFGAKVTLIGSQNALHLPRHQSIQTYPMNNTKELQQLIHQLVPQHDVLIMAAAVSDYHIEQPATTKIKKTNDQKNLTLNLVENPDILRSIKDQAIIKIGFAAETDHVIEYARAKRLKKGLDVIVANDVSQTTIGFNSDENQVTIIDQKGERNIKRQHKDGVALNILNVLTNHLKERN